MRDDEQPQNGGAQGGAPEGDEPAGSRVRTDNPPPDRPNTSDDEAEDGVETGVEGEDERSQGAQDTSAGERDEEDRDGKAIEAIEEEGECDSEERDDHRPDGNEVDDEDAGEEVDGSTADIAAGDDSQDADARQRPAEFRVFVYGSLMRGGQYHHLLKYARFEKEAATPPTHTLVSMGPYPALLAEGDTAVHGEIYTVGLATLGELDTLEGHPSFYVRTHIDLADGTQAITYLLPPGRARSARPISSGRWNARARCPG